MFVADGQALVGSVGSTTSNPRASVSAVSVRLVLAFPPAINTSRRRRWNPGQPYKKGLRPSPLGDVLLLPHGAETLGRPLGCWRGTVPCRSGSALDSGAPLPAILREPLSRQCDGRERDWLEGKEKQNSPPGVSPSAGVCSVSGSAGETTGGRREKEWAVRRGNPKAVTG